MGDLTKDFSRHEFACRDADGELCECGMDTVDYQLLRYLQDDFRDFFDARVTITSGCRCPAQNTRVTKNPNSRSQHLYGRGADFVVDGVPAHIVQERARDIDVPGLGCYTGHTHIDSRTGRARWTG